MSEETLNTLEDDPGASGPTTGSEEGCLKPVLIGCGTLALFLGIALFVMASKADDLLRWTVEKIELQVVSTLPKEIDEERVRRLHEAFVVAGEALASGRVDPLELQRFQGALIDYSRSAAERLTVTDVDRLILALERFGGLAPAPLPEPDPGPGALPTVGPLAFI